MEPMQSSFGHTFSGIFPLGTLAQFSYKTSFLAKSSNVHMQQKLCTRAKRVLN
jgi:hypothetical protein